MKDSTVAILNHIVATTIYSVSEVYNAYSTNMTKYGDILSEFEILECMELHGLYSIDNIVKLANAGE